MREAGGIDGVELRQQLPRLLSLALSGRKRVLIVALRIELCSRIDLERLIDGRAWPNSLSEPAGVARRSGWRHCGCQTFGRPIGGGNGGFRRDPVSPTTARSQIARIGRICAVTTESEDPIQLRPRPRRRAQGFTLESLTA